MTAQRSYGDATLATAGDLSKRINGALVGTGWRVFEVSLDTATGHARVAAERRDWQGRRGVRVTLHRGCYGSRVLEMRDATELRPGMYKEFWTIVDGGHLGRRRHLSFKSGLLMLANYIDDNALPSALPWQGRRALGLLAERVDIRALATEAS